jgi:hypothetical protein
MLSDLDPPPDLIFWIIPIVIGFAAALRASTPAACFAASLIATLAATIVHVAYIIVSVGYSPTATTLDAAATFFPYLFVCGATVFLFSLARAMFRGRL